MLVRLSALLSLLFGVWAVFAVVTILGVYGGGLAGALATICGLAALSERPEGWTRRAALIGLVTGGLAIFGLLVFLVLAAFGV